MHLVSIFVNSGKRRENQIQHFPPCLLSLRVILFPQYGGKEIRYHLFQILKKNYSYVLGEEYHERESRASSTRQERFVYLKMLLRLPACFVSVGQTEQTRFHQCRVMHLMNYAAQCQHNIGTMRLKSLIFRQLVKRYVFK